MYYLKTHRHPEISATEKKQKWFKQCHDNTGTNNVRMIYVT